MITQYLHHLFADPALLLCSLTMLTLFAVDLFGLVGNRLGLIRWRPVSFSTTVVSVGLFATFLGVLSGLYSFNPMNVSASVPTLLEGLRFAFAGSVLGMGLSLVLSVSHKMLGQESENEEVLHSIDRKIGSLVATLQAPGELVKQFNEMKNFLTEHLQRINSSLERALEQLARGATQEVIVALEQIIKDFNQNLTTQFGDNFRQLNVACSRLVEWQTKYQEHIEHTEMGLRHVTQTLDQSCAAAKQLTLSNENIQRTCLDVSRLIKTYDIQTATLEEHLRSCKDLGTEAQAFLSSTQSALAEAARTLDSFSAVIQKSVGKQSEALTQLTTDIDHQLPKALGELENVLTSITNQFAADYRSLFQFVTKNQ
ncbi:MAG: hypothetical protein U0136_15510 [Bdellovibrionota bacterium]